MKNKHVFSNKPAGPIRNLLAFKRLLKDPENTAEAAVLEMTFSRSRWGKKAANWEALAEETRAQSPLVVEAMNKRLRVLDIDLESLIKLPENSLGYHMAISMKDREITASPLETLPVETDADWLMAHMYETHDFWHMLTGFSYDLKGEWGIAGVYMGQLPRFTFGAFMMSIIFLQGVFYRRDELGVNMKAFVDGYQLGRDAKCMVGLDWASLWHRDLDELRQELNIREAGGFAELAQAA